MILPTPYDLSGEIFYPKRLPNESKETKIALHVPLKSNDIKVRADGVYYIILSTCWAYEVNEVIFEKYLLLHFSFRCHAVL